MRLNLNVPVIDLSKGDETKKDAVEVDKPHNIDTQVIVYDPLIKEKQLVLDEVG